MQSKRTFPLSLMVVAILSGCSSVPPNANLMAAHSRYDAAAFNPDVVNQAPLELQEANNALTLADGSFNKGEDEADVNHLAYLANQQVAIAEETAKRKSAELAVSNAGAKRDKIRLDARTTEANAAEQQVAIAHATTDRQATELAVAGANAEHDQALIAQLKGLNAKQTDRGMMITLGDVLFNTDRAELKPGGIRNIEKLAQFMTQYPAYKVSVEGHTDSRASVRHNQRLSDRRADAVQTALLDQSISSDRITTHGFGKQYPIASNKTPAGRQLNRRVEIILSDDNGKISQR